MSAPDEGNPSSLVTLRSAVILMLGLQVAAATAALTIIAGSSWAVAVLAAGPAFLGSVMFGRTAIGH